MVKKIFIPKLKDKKKYKTRDKKKASKVKGRKPSPGGIAHV